MFSSTFAAALIGLIWGITNPFIKTGSQELNRRLEGGKRSTIAVVLTTPKYWIPQFLNILAAIGFVRLLSVGDLSVVAPIANAASLAINTVIDLALGEKFNLLRLGLGLVFIGFGIFLCSL